MNLITIGKLAAATTAILLLTGSVWKVASFLGVAPVSSMELRKVEKQYLENDIPLLAARSRSLRITRGLLKQLPQTLTTISDIEAYNDEIDDYDVLLSTAKSRAMALR